MGSNPTIGFFVPKSHNSIFFERAVLNAGLDNLVDDEILYVRLTNDETYRNSDLFNFQRPISELTAILYSI